MMSLTLFLYLLVIRLHCNEMNIHMQESTVKMIKLVLDYVLSYSYFMLQRVCYSDTESHEEWFKVGVWKTPEE